MKSTKTPSSTRRQAGFTLIELGLVLAIVALVLGGVILAFQMHKNNTTKNLSVQYITLISSNAKQLFGQAGAYGDVNTEIAVRSGLIPRELRIAGTNTANNPYGAPITVTPGNGTGTNDLLVLGWGNVPGVEACNSIVRSVERDLRRVVVAGTTVKPLDGVLNSNTLTTACDVPAGVVALELAIGRS